MKYKIPLRNKNKEVIDYTIVSKKDYEHLNQFKWSKSDKGYTVGIINKKSWSMHRYIMIHILENNITSHVKIDHINSNKLNNKRNNLRVVTNSENARNKLKSKSATSKFYGVSYISKKNKYQCSLEINGETFFGIYDNEYHSAHHYNLLCKQHNLITAKINIIPIELLIDFKLYKSKDKLDNLPKCISLTYNKKFRVRINSILYGTFDNLEDAIIIKNNKLTELEQLNKELKPILRNKNNEAIIELFNNKKKKISETIVDEDIYQDLIKYKWYISNGYVLGKINKKSVRLHRYVLNYEHENDVDHINNNPLDNRKCNLRIITRLQNNRNKTSAKNSSSKYVGVTFNKKSNKWQSYITFDKKKIHLGYFENENEAAKARNEATLKYFGEHGNLNIIKV